MKQFFTVYVSLIQGGEAAGQWFSFTPSTASCPSELLFGNTNRLTLLFRYGASCSGCSPHFSHERTG